MRAFFILGTVFLCLCGCMRGQSVPSGYQPRYSRFVGYKEDVLTRAVGRPDSVYYDDYGRRYLVYDTFSMDDVSMRYGPYQCSTMFLTGRGFVKASFFDESKCIRVR